VLDPVLPLPAGIAGRGFDAAEFTELTELAELAELAGLTGAEAPAGFGAAGIGLFACAAKGDAAAGTLALAPLPATEELLGTEAPAAAGLTEEDDEAGLLPADPEAAAGAGAAAGHCQTV
jgi:hypothetical protein